MLGRGGLITVLIFSLALAGCGGVASYYAKEKLERRKDRSQSMQDVRGPSTEEEWGI